jgi:hypothetical protein
VDGGTICIIYLCKWFILLPFHHDFCDDIFRGLK